MTAKVNSIFGVRKVNVVRFLEKKYDGKWKYIHHLGWKKDDNKTICQMVTGCSCDDYCDHPVRYYVYFGDRAPEEIHP